MEKPKIRFKGYQEDWEQRKFDEVFDCTIPNNTLSRAELNYESGSVRNIHYGDILIKYGSVVDVQNDEIPFATGKSSDDFKGALLQDGDIIIADTAEDETTGKACEIGNSQGLDVVSGLHTMVCRPRNKMALGYLGYYLNSDAYHHQLLPLMQGIKVLSLSRTNVQKTMVCYPKSKTEQQLIADCFRNLDNLITLHQRKCEEMKTLKKYMLQKMFPQNGQSVPQIRFSGFTEDWEQRKLSDVVDSVDTGKSRFDKEGLSGEYPILGSTSVIGYDDEYDYEGDFILTARVGANAGSLYRHAGKVKISDNTVFIQASQNIEFLYQLLSQFDIKKLSFGTGQPLVKASELKSLELMMPSDMKEQMRIGVYFKNLDSLITLHQQKCDELRNIKKFMLQNMFI